MRTSPFFSPDSDSNENSIIAQQSDDSFSGSISSLDYFGEAPVFPPLFDSRHIRAPTTPFYTSDTRNIKIEEMPIDSSRRQSRKSKNSSVFNTLPRSKRYAIPITLPLSLSEDDEFKMILSDTAILFNPQSLGFIPSHKWSNCAISFGELYKTFFRISENANIRFFQKLYNALCISSNDPFYISYIGVSWINEKVLKVNLLQFSRLCGISGSEISLIGPQGKFPSHGFSELSEKEALSCCTYAEIEGVDFISTRLFVHNIGIFVRGCTEEQLNECKWVCVRRRNSVHE